jgi:hypothetical protein
MREILEVERLGSAAASSLASYLTHELGPSAKVRAIRGSRVEAETQSGSLPEILSVLEGWGQRSAISSLCVRVDGRSYTLETSKTAKTLRPATT